MHEALGKLSGGTGGTVILAPHADDAAFSIGGLLLKSVLAPPIDLVTVFGRSNYLRDFGFLASWRAVTLRRQQEDTRFATLVGCRLMYLELPEAGLRLAGSPPPIFTPPSEREIARAISVLHQSLAPLAPQYLLAPLGLGGHRDHLLVRHAAGQLSTALGALCIYYEDLPYAASVPDKEIQASAVSISPALRPLAFRIDDGLASKLEAARLYRTQWRREILHAISAHALRLGGGIAYERLWLTAGTEPTAGALRHFVDRLCTYPRGAGR